MKKIIFGLLIALSLIGCQQPNIDYSDFSDADTSKQEEHNAIIDEYRTSFEEYRIELEEKLNIFQEPFDGSSGYNIDGEWVRVISVLDEFSRWELSYSSALNYFETRPELYHTVKDIPSYQMADACRPFVESIKKDLEELKSQYIEVQSLIKEVNNVLNELDSMDVERIVVNKIEFENKIKNLSIEDIRYLIDIYGEFYPELRNYQYVYSERYDMKYLYPELYKRVFNENN